MARRAMRDLPRVALPSRSPNLDGKGLILTFETLIRYKNKKNYGRKTNGRRSEQIKNYKILEDHKIQLVNTFHLTIADGVDLRDSLWNHGLLQMEE